MSVFDPSLERSPLWPPLREEQEAAMLRHDILAALAGVTDGARQLAERLVEADAGTRAQAERVAAAADALGRLVDLAFGGVRPEPQADLDRLMTHLRHRHAGAARDAGTGFRVEMDPQLPSRLRLDPLSLSRVLDNLVAAALGACPGGSVALSARQDGGGDVIFAVTGEPGAGREAAAAGPMALQVAEKLAARLEGRLVLAAAGGRSEATLRFPASAAMLAAPGLPVPPRLAGVRILLAEDNPTNQMVASNMLRALDAEVLVCSDGVEALERFERFDADLVVVDIEMPRLTGLDVIRAIRARTDAKANVPIVALTAYAMREHRDRIILAGANGLIPKPITSIDALGRELSAHVRIITASAGGPGAAAAPEAAPPDDMPVMDLKVFDELCRTIGPELVDELKEKVVADLVDSRARLEGALQPFERSVIESTSHILISVAGAFGAVRLQLRSRALNTASRDRAVPRETIAADVRLCVAEIEAAVGFARSRAGGA